ncbi:MAG: secondary thiamine-phosphate synthase enzyme YjbQ [Phycisphaerales bacterium]
MGHAATEELRLRSAGEGLHECTADVAAAVSRLLGAAGDGLCTVFVRHTSASLVIQENADPSARRDLEAWLARLVPHGDPSFTHVAEGPDDMPAHIRAALTATSLSIPIVDGRLGLGTWQGIYLWEHRTRPPQRRVLVNVVAG